MRHAICYVSTSNKDLDKAQIEALLNFTQERNIELGIKGMLLFSDGHFFQIIEGEKEVILDVFIKIKKDSRHHGINTIVSKDIPEDSYDEYVVDILNEDFKLNYKVPGHYREALNGLPNEVRNTMKQMLERFISSS